MNRLSFLLVTCAALGLAGCQQAANVSANMPNSAQAGEAPQGASEYDVVRSMLELANVGPNDLVVDLGSGDGRIPILAAREKGARGMGVEIDPRLIEQSDANAREAGVADKVSFRQEDLFVTRLNDVTVLTLFLLPEINLQLRPKILLQMRPGSRVVSNTFDMGDWRPDARREVGGTTILMWTVPARVEGRWRLTQGEASAELALSQSFQDLSGQAGGRNLGEPSLAGDRIAFTTDLGQGTRRFEGRVEGDRIVGEGWEAVRSGG